MPGITIKVEEVVPTGDDLLIGVLNIKHGDIDLDTITVVVNDEEISPGETNYALDVSKERLCVTNLTDVDWEIGDVITVAWHKVGDLNDH